jgi:hypothetical protein
MKPLLFREVKRKLEAAGFFEVGQTGSHIKFSRQLAPERERQRYRSTAKLPPARYAAFCVKPE